MKKLKFGLEEHLGYSFKYSYERAKFWASQTVSYGWPPKHLFNMAITHQK